MQEDFFISVTKYISSTRFEAYQVSERDQLRKKLVYYTWNILLSESLYPVLHMVEVALRNSIHETVADAYATTSWLIVTPTILNPMEQESIKRAREKLQREHKPLEEGRLIAELSFGFWTSLLDARYEQVLWPRLLKAAFPAMPRRIRTRRTLSKRFSEIRYLRNRIFHHEPIWKRTDLLEQHIALLETLDWISPVLRQTIEVVDRFPQVYNHGWNECQRRIDVVLGAI